MRIQDQEFEDFDEILARHISPMAAFAREIMAYKYYKPDDYESPEICEAYLMAEQARNPKKIHYLFCASRKFPGKFVLAYLPKNRVIQEYISVTPTGFRYRREHFQNIADLII